MRILESISSIQEFKRSGSHAQHRNADDRATGSGRGGRYNACTCGISASRYCSVLRQLMAVAAHPTLHAPFSFHKNFYAALSLASCNCRRRQIVAAGSAGQISTPVESCTFFEVRDLKLTPICGVTPHNNSPHLSTLPDSVQCTDFGCPLNFSLNIYSISISSTEKSL